MKSKTLLWALLAGSVMSACATKPVAKEEPTLKSVLGDKFLIGVAVNVWQSSERDTNAVKIVKKHFNSVVAENCMKCQTIHPEENRYSSPNLF